MLSVEWRKTEIGTTRVLNVQRATQNLCSAGLKQTLIFNSHGGSLLVGRETGGTVEFVKVLQESRGIIGTYSRGNGLAELNKQTTHG